MIEGLWGEEFVLPEKPKARKILDKIEKKKKSSENTAEKVAKSKKISFAEKALVIEENVKNVLGKQIDNVLVIFNKDELHDYLSRGLKYGRISIDTETNNSLDPITCKLMGLCLYVKGEKQVYVPINHVNPDSNIRLDNQLTEQDIHDELTWLMENKGDCIFVFHNGKFDYQVIKCTCNVELDIDWDTMIGAKLLDENEKSAGLKQQYIDKIDSDQEKYSIDKLFEGLEYSLFKPELFALYAATDAMMTDRLYEYQRDRFSDPDLSGVLHLAKELEMPVVKVIAEMELAGLEVDEEYAKLLAAKYHKKLDKLDAEIADQLALIKDKIDAWRLTNEANAKPKNKKGDGEGKSKSEQLTDPINLASPTQLAILFYDVLKCPQVSKKHPRGTGEDELLSLSAKMKMPIFELLLQRRGLMKLLTGYIDTIPELAKQWPDGRVRTHFNQYGAATGRLSSSDPINFQNIPSGNKEIRMLFKAKDGYSIIGGDYSGQEPRLSAFYSQDENMINAYKEKRDLYSVIASLSFNVPYEDCLEFYPEGTKLKVGNKEVICGYKTHKNEAGKDRRTSAKSILLGVLYGRGAASVGEQIHKTKEEAQDIIDKFFNAFPRMHRWINKTIDDVYKTGYVEDIAFRRRRLPDILLPKYEFKDLNEEKNVTFNPFLTCEDRKQDNKLIDKYKAKLEKIKGRKDYENIQKEALNEGIEIHDNTGFIAQAERQAVNSRVQGGAATLTKNALLALYNNKRLKEIGAYLVNTVHDEILIEAPDEYAEEAANILTSTMISSAKKYVTNVPMECDAYCVKCWYLDEFFEVVKDEFNKLLKKNNNDDLLSFEQMCEERQESTREQIYEIVHQQMTHRPEGVETYYN